MFNHLNALQYLLRCILFCCVAGNKAVYYDLIAMFPDIIDC